MKGSGRKVLKRDALLMKGQTVVGRAFANLMRLVPKEYVENFACGIPIETELKDGNRKICPDITFYNLCENQDGKDDLIDLLFVMDFVRNTDEKLSTETIKGIFKCEPALVEFFLYDFEKETWTRFAKKDGEIVPESTTYSLTFKCDIASVVEYGSCGKSFLKL